MARPQPIIAAYRKMDEALQAANRFLAIANRHHQMEPLLQEFIREVREFTGCQAVAVRILRDEGKIPYEAYEGFPPEFIAQESPLSIWSDQCLCINVMKRATDPKLPCYTEGSSCYINKFSELLATVPPEVRGPTRNVCHRFGFESVALVPIMLGESILGLIHVADPQVDKVPLEKVQVLEKVAWQLGTALQRVTAEEALRQALSDSRQRQAEIAALLKAARAILESHDFAGAARDIFDSCKKITGGAAGYVALLSRDGSRNEPLFLDSGGMVCRVDPNLPMPLRGLRAEVYHHGRPMYHNDFAASDYARYMPPGHAPLKNVLFAPLMVKGEAVGLLGIANKPEGFTENDARLAAGFGELAAIALINSRAEEDQQRLLQQVQDFSEELQVTNEELQATNEELQAQAQELQAQKMELERLTDDLKAQRRFLEAANRELEAFSYSVSHDLRAPVRAIGGFARILADEYGSQLDAEGRRLLEVIRTNTRLMGNLIDDLLTLSRLGRKELKSWSVDLGAMTGSIFQDLQAQAPDRRLELILKPLPPARGDRTMINQVLVNLLSNSIKFTRPREKAIIEVGGWTEEKENIYYVRDNGVGFDMQYADKLFGVFQRLHRREDFEGTGVGLAIVHRIIQRHGGRVWATGKVGEGATFYFSLPRMGERRESQ